MARLPFGMPEEENMKHTIAASMLAAALALPFAAQAADYAVMAPAAPGGGWDQTARAI